MNKIQLMPYLPSVDELEAMDNSQLEKWLITAKQDIKTRQIERDPLTHLRKKLWRIIESNLPDAAKEDHVLEAIEWYESYPADAK